MLHVGRLLGGLEGDAGAFPAPTRGLPLDGWPGERWLDVRSPAVLDLMRARIARLAEKGCRAVEFDNVDGYANRTGFALTRVDQVRFNRALARAARDIGLSPGLKNAVGLVPALVSSFDWALNEECVTYGECRSYAPFPPVPGSRCSSWSTGTRALHAGLPRRCALRPRGGAPPRSRTSTSMPTPSAADPPTTNHPFREWAVVEQEQGAVTAMARHATTPLRPAEWALLR